jgi:hypothetical protein
MKASSNEVAVGSRRNMLAGSAALLAGGGLGSVMTSFVRSASAADPSPAEPPPLPWKWAKLDPLEAGRRAYRGYLTKPPGG